MKKSLIFTILIIAIILIISFVYINKEETENKSTSTEMKIISPVFKSNEKIPAKYTCQGDDINPQLEISDIPKNAKSLALIMDDPDAPAGTWDHWILFNIPPETKQISESSVPKNAVQGKNSWKENKYGGPCPPSGTHRYSFKLYALDTTLNLNENANKADVETAMKNHILAKTELIGLYSKI